MLLYKLHQAQRLQSSLARIGFGSRHGQGFSPTESVTRLLWAGFPNVQPLRCPPVFEILFVGTGNQFPIGRVGRRERCMMYDVLVVPFGRTLRHYLDPPLAPVRVVRDREFMLILNKGPLGLRTVAVLKKKKSKKTSNADQV